MKIIKKYFQIMYKDTDYFLVKIGIFAAKIEK